jgi:LmbE family N-acetylglucosaminyl deacetylase
MRKKALGIFAHPDDAEFTCSGTLCLLRKAGWSVHIATLAPGDKGTNCYTREEVSRIRIKEAEKAAAVIGASYDCLDFEDVYIMYDRESINKTTALIRRIRPGIVFTLSPDDYMMDHEITSLIVQTACFSAGIKNMEVTEKPFEPVPYLFYGDPIEAKDKMGNRIEPLIYVDITSEIKTREEMLACHESQRNWLHDHHDIDEYVLMMKRVARMRGKEVNIEYAEGFRQHRGHGFPQDNILGNILGKRVHANGPTVSYVS